MAALDDKHSDCTKVPVDENRAYKFSFEPSKRERKPIGKYCPPPQRKRWAIS